MADESLWEAMGPTEIKRQEIVLTAKIATGAYGTVYRGECRGKTVAIKKLKFNVPQGELQSFKREVDILRRLNHPNITMLLGACIQEGEFAIVMELCATNLTDYLKNFAAKDALSTRLRIATEIAESLAWLHSLSPPIIHKDLKPDNILLTHGFTAKLADFGLSSLNKGEGLDLKDREGNLLFKPPERLKVTEDVAVTEKSDVYGYALLLYALAGCEALPPNGFDTPKRLLTKIAEKGLRPPIADSVPLSIQNVINACWAQSPADRPCMVDVASTMRELIVNIAIPQPAVAAMWHKRFPGLVSAPLDKLLHYLYQLIDDYAPASDTDDYAVLQLYLCDDNRNVNIEKLGRLVANFPIDPEADEFYHEPIVTLCKQEWFHGDILDKQKASERLKTEKDGCFLVRFSATKGYFALTYNTVTSAYLMRPDVVGTKHKRIKVHEDGSVSVTISDNNTVTAPNLISLIPKIKKPLKLTKDCPRNPYYSKLFMKTKVVEGGYDEFKPL